MKKHYIVAIFAFLLAGGIATSQTIPYFQNVWNPATGYTQGVPLGLTVPIAAPQFIGDVAGDAGYFKTLVVSGTVVETGSPITKGTIVADAGNLAGLTVNGNTTLTGATTMTGSPNVLGTLVADAGNVSSLTVQGTATTTNETVLSTDVVNVLSADAGTFGGPITSLVWDGGSALSLKAIGSFICFNPPTCTQIIGDRTSDGSLQVGPAGAAVLIGAASTPVYVNGALAAQVSLATANGTTITNLGVGSCTLGSGQCNAVVAGANGSSLCTASVQGTSQTLVGCDVRADAGSATAFCQSTASGTAAIICFN